MRFTKKFVRIAVAAAVTVFSTVVSAETILKLAHTDQVGGGRDATSHFFAKKVEELTNGKYKVKVFCCGQLGNDPRP